MTASPDLLTSLNRVLVVVARVGRRLMIRTSHGRFRPLWRLAYVGLVRGLAWSLRVMWGESVYVRGSFAAGEPIFGLSDVDLVVLTSGERPMRGRDPERVRSWLTRFYELLPAVGHVLEVSVVDQTELTELFVTPLPADPVIRDAGCRPSGARFHNGRSFGRQGARPEGGLPLRAMPPLAAPGRSRSTGGSPGKS